MDNGKIYKESSTQWGPEAENNMKGLADRSPHMVVGGGGGEEVRAKNRHRVGVTMPFLGIYEEPDWSVCDSWAQTWGAENLDCIDDLSLHM